MKKSILKYFAIPWYLQIMAWTLLFVVHFQLKVYIFENIFVRNEDFVVYFLITIGFFYLNILWILPRYVGSYPKFTNNVILLLGLEFLTLTCLVYLIGITDFFYISFLFFYGFLWSGLAYLFLWGFYQKGKSRQIWRDNAQLKRLVALRRKSWLNASLNPHIIYNMLPMLEFTIEHKPEKANRALNILNEIMVYYLRVPPDGLISLQEELEQVKHLLALNQIRLSRKASLKVIVSGDLTGIKIPSMLLLLLVENIFKYGIFYDPSCYAQLCISVKNDCLSISTKNKINRLNSGVSTGSGLRKLKDRLNHCYPNNHTFQVRNNKDTFTVSLLLDFSVPLLLSRNETFSSFSDSNSKASNSNSYS